MWFSRCPSTHSARQAPHSTTLHLTPPHCTSLHFPPPPSASTPTPSTSLHLPPPPFTSLHLHSTSLQLTWYIRRQLQLEWVGIPSYGEPAYRSTRAHVCNSMCTVQQWLSVNLHILCNCRIAVTCKNQGSGFKTTAYSINYMINYMVGLVLMGTTLCVSSHTMVEPHT